MDLNRFFSDLASEKPVPGGGSASCVAAAMGVSLVEMVARLSVGRGEEASDEKAFTGMVEDLPAKKARLFQLAEEDAAGYRQVMRAFRLPKDTEQEKTRRKEEIQKAFEGAITPPLTLMEMVVDLLNAAGFVLERGNRNAFSDAAVAYYLFKVAFEGGRMNVLINLGSLQDASRKQFILTQLSRLEKAFDEKKRETEEMIQAWIDKNPA